jgi:hypothetical protein
LNALFYTVPTAIFSVLLGHPGYAIAEFSSFPVIMGGSNMVASLLEKPEVVSWLSKINDKDVEAFNKLPPEQRAVFTQDMKDLADAAKKKGVAVSPVFSRFVNKPLVKGAIRVAGGYAGVANANKPSLEEIKKQAQDLHDQMYKGGLAPAPATTPPLQEATPDPQSSLRPTHIFNATKGIIEAA